MSRTCFVIMPVQREGTEDYDHFKALYENVIKATVAPLGYDVVRADEVQKSGAITRDIVLRLAQAHLVVADLTALNPNVFYELGVRHSLRGQGTVMILDELRTDSIPFDLGAYRVIKFRGEITGLAKIRHELTAFVEGLRIGEEDYRDNPVHDWMPALPLNALQASTESTEGALRQQLSQLQKQVQHYESAYGIAKVAVEDASPLSIVMNVLAEAKDGNLPSDLLQRADAAAGRRDKTEFLETVARVMESQSAGYAARDIVALVSHAQNLGLDSIVSAIFDHAARLDPNDRDLKKRQLAFNAHSSDPSKRATARMELQSITRVTLAENGAVTVPEQIAPESLELLGVMLDAFRADDLNEQALAITQALVERLPDMSIVMRNHARALEDVGRHVEALEYYEKSIKCSDTTDVSAVWLGNEMHNRGRHADALESYLLACLLDLDDANGFAHVASECSLIVKKHLLASPTKPDDRPLPAYIEAASVETAIWAALSCPLIDEADLVRCNEVAKREAIDIAGVLSKVEERESEHSRGRRMTRQDRFEFASGLHQQCKSGLTDRSTRVS